MKRRSPALLAVVVLLGVSYLSYQESQSIKRRAALDKQVESSKPATDPDQGSKDEAEAATATTAATRDVAEGSESMARFDSLPDGSPVPPLPESAPQRVKLGVALFRYAGAQGAPASTRAKAEALALAKNAVAEAEKEFLGAVKQGDRGSAENVGWVPRGILEKSVEYEVFRLEQGALLTTPLDTPRGYWVVKRLR